MINFLFGGRSRCIRTLLILCSILLLLFFIVFSAQLLQTIFPFLPPARSTHSMKFLALARLCILVSGLYCLVLGLLWTTKYKVTVLPYFPVKSVFRFWPLFLIASLPIALTLLMKNGESNVWNYLAPFGMVDAIVVHILIFSIIFFSLYRLTGRFILSAVYLVLFGVMTSVDIITLVSTGYRFHPMILNWANPKTTAGFVTVTNVAIVFGVGGLLYVLFKTVKPIATLFTWDKIRRMLIFLLLILLLQPLFLTFSFIRLAYNPVQFGAGAHELVWYEVEGKSLDCMSNMAKALFEPNRDIWVTSISPQLIENAATLDLGIQDPAQIEILQSPFKKPITRVIFITVESLNLNFIKRYNKEIGESITPFLDTLPPSFESIHCCALPTDPGLAAHYCSHPNIVGLFKYKYPNSFVKLLGKEGWKTVAFRSAPLIFSDYFRRYNELGFEESYGADRPYKAYDKKYVNGMWDGACDRLTFSDMLKYLKEHRNEKVFMSFLNLDTHFIGGRNAWGSYEDLEYPELPEWAKSNSNRDTLESIFRFDHDLKLFIDSLEREGLFDEQTLIIITSDHVLPLGISGEGVPGVKLSNSATLPFFVLTKQEMTGIPMDGNRFATQMATAPTLFHLLGLKPSPAWWGKSLYSREYVPPMYIGSITGNTVINSNLDPRTGNSEIQRILHEVYKIFISDQEASSEDK